MIRFDGVGVRYPDSPAPALTDVTFRVPEGELALVVGPTGAGKSTLLRAAAGLVPHFSGGHLTGTVVVAGRDTRTHLPRDLADVVGVVGQAPATGFVTDSVEEELAYGMEQIGLEPGVMRRRVEEVLDLLDLAPLRHRPLADLSGGEQQRVAIGAVLTSRPRVLVLDEPTSALDPGAAEEVLAALTRLVHDLGLTVLVAEHRLERVVQYADRVIVVGEDGRVTSDAPSVALATAPVAPPVVELGRLAGWDPLPLSVREAQLYLFLFLAAVAVGTVVGGPVGDRIGRKIVIWVSILGVAPFTLMLPHATLFWTGVLVVIIGVVLASAFSAIVVYAQELVPGKVGMIAGLFFGFAFGMGGLGAAVLGRLADATSIGHVYQLCAYLPLLGVVAILLPKMRRV